jgi:hypothetical protein
LAVVFENSAALTGAADVEISVRAKGEAGRLEQTPVPLAMKLLAGEAEGQGYWVTEFVPKLLTSKPLCACRIEILSSNPRKISALLMAMRMAYLL